MTRQPDDPITGKRQIIWPLKMSAVGVGSRSDAASQGSSFLATLG